MPLNLPRARGLGYSGHVVNLPQDVSSFASTLPRRPQDLDVIVVRRENSNQSYHDFRVRRSAVLNALQWLVANNKYYQHITINTDQLPEDGTLSGLCTITLNPTPDEEQDAGSDGADDQFSTSFIPSAPRRATEREAVQRAVHQSGQPPQVVSWPPTGAPLNEFTTSAQETCHLLLQLS